MKKLKKSEPARRLNRDRRMVASFASFDGQLMVIAAHCYCLDRQGYHAAACVGLLLRWWTSLHDDTRIRIAHHTLAALQSGRAGDTETAAVWKSFMEWAWPQMNEESKIECRYGLVDKHKPWPLSID